MTLVVKDAYETLKLDPTQDFKRKRPSYNEKIAKIHHPIRFIGRRRKKEKHEVKSKKHEAKSKKHKTKEVHTKGKKRTKRAGLIKFYADWCPACISTKPHIIELSRMPHYKDRVHVVDISNQDDQHAQNLARKLEIQTIPSIFISNKHGYLTPYQGPTQVDDLKRLLDNILEANNN